MTATDLLVLSAIARLSNPRIFVSLMRALPMLDRASIQASLGRLLDAGCIRITASGYILAVERAR